MTYKMIDDVTLSNFRRFMASGIPLKEFSPQGAFDARPRRAKDQGEEPEEPKARGSLIRFLKVCANGMTPEGWAQFQRDLLDETEEGAEDDETFSSPVEREERQLEEPARDKRAKDKTARDEPLIRPRPGGTIDPLKPATDGKLTGNEGAYFANFAKSRPSGAARRFADLYPGAASIKVY